MATVHSDLTTRALSLQPTDLDRLNKAPTARDFHPSSENQNNAGPRDMQENGQGLDRVDSLSLDPAVFEKLFLTPQTLVKHDLRKMFAVPTPLCVCLPLFPHIAERAKMKTNALTTDRSSGLESLSRLLHAA